MTFTELKENFPQVFKEVDALPDGMWSGAEEIRRRKDWGDNYIAPFAAALSVERFREFLKEIELTTKYFTHLNF